MSKQLTVRDKAELFDRMLADHRIKAGMGFSTSFGEVYLDAIHASCREIIDDVRAERPRIASGAR